MRTPSARNQIGNGYIYVSQYLLGGGGPLTISDFGQARIGMEHFGNAMPVPYRAPEVILGMPWGPAVDTWSVGLLVQCFRSCDIFTSLTLFRLGIFWRGSLYSMYTITTQHNEMTYAIWQIWQHFLVHHHCISWKRVTWQRNPGMRKVSLLATRRIKSMDSILTIFRMQVSG